MPRKVKPRKQTRSYWEQRSIERSLSAERRSEKYLRRINRIYEASRRDTIKSIHELYKSYYAEDGFNTQKLREITPSADLRKFRQEVAALGLAKRLPKRYSARLNRLEMLNAQLWLESKKNASKMHRMSSNLFKDTVEESFYRSVYDTSKGMGVTPSFTQLDTKTLDRVLKSKFYGKNYSDRIWKNSDIFAQEVQEVIARSIATGAPLAKTTREIRTRYGGTQHTAERLIKTETAYFQTIGEVESYRAMGVKKYQILATLDRRTSDICQRKDKKIYNVNAFLPGTNAPPFHPYCRTTIIPYFGKRWEPEVRIARDIDGKNEYVSNMNYDEWIARYKKKVTDLIGSTASYSVSANLVKTDYGVSYDMDSLSGIDSELLKASAARLEELVNEYPELKSWLVETDRLLINGGNLGIGTYAATRRDASLMTLSRGYFASSERLMGAIEKGMRSGHFMPAKSTKLYTIDHEFGHVVENYILRKRNTDAGAMLTLRDIMNIAKSEYGVDMKIYQQTVSRYGKANAREFFAEAFANAHGGKPNVIGLAMRKYLERKFK